MAQSSLVKNSSFYLFAAGVNVAVPFLALPIILRAMSPEQFGLMGLYLALVNIAVVFVGLGVHGIISVVHFRDGPSAVPAYLKTISQLVVLTSLPLIGICLIFAEPLEALTGLPGAWIWTITLIAFFQFFVMMAMAVFQAREEPKLYVALQVSLTLGWVFLTVLFVWGMGFGWQGRAVGQILSATLVASMAITVLFRKKILSFTVAGAPMSALLKFGIPLVPHALAAAVMAGADRLILSKVGTVEMAGLYFAAFQICALITVAAAAINQAWVPWLYKRLAEPSLVGNVEIVRVTYALFVLFVIGSGLVVVFAPLIVPMVAGPAYLAAVPVIKFLAPAAAFSGMYYFVTNYLFYFQRTGVLSIVTLAVTCLQLGLLLMLVPKWGIDGAAIATMVAAFVYWVSIWSVSQRIAPLPWIKALRWGHSG